MKTAFFLGAGASNTFGYPMTSHVLPLILQRLLQDTLFTSFGPSKDTHGFDRERFRTILTRFVPGWKQAYDAANKDLDAGTWPRPIGVGVTDVLTLVDHILATPRHPARDRGGFAARTSGRPSGLTQGARYGQEQAMPFGLRGSSRGGLAPFALGVESPQRTSRTSALTIRPAGPCWGVAAPGVIGRVRPPPRLRVAGVMKWQT